VWYRFKQCLNKYSKTQTGAVAIIFVYWVIPAIIVAGMATDISRLIYLNSRLSTAVDAAAVAAGRYDSASAIINANNVFRANFPAGFMGVTVTPVVTISSDLTIITVSGNCQMPTILGKYVNINTLKTSATATVTRSLIGLELAMVLDISGSMYEEPGGASLLPASPYSNSKIYALQIAATNFLNSIYGATANTRANTSVSIVPFMMTVNIGTTNTSWLTDPATVTNKTYFPTGAPWKGCVKARTPFANEFNENPPSTQKWPTYYTASTLPFHTNKKSGQTDSATTPWDNDYSIVGTSISVINKPIIYGFDASSYVNIGPNRGCSSAILPVNNNKTQLIAAINALTPLYTGGTDGSLGLAWGWRTISPSWSGLWNGSAIKSYTAANNLKAVIFMTDGVSQWADWSTYPAFDFTAYYTIPNPSNGNRLTSSGFATTADGAQTAIENNITKLCTAMKAKGIEIYIILFQVNDAQTQSVYKSCATDSAHYFEALSASDLNAQFQTIANNLQQLVITQ